jgi:hypothetical protein
MNTKQLEKVLYHDPFQPFSVVLQNGEEIFVKKPRKASISADRLAIVGLTRLPSGAQRQGLRFIPVEDIVSASHIGSDSLS